MRQWRLRVTKLAVAGTDRLFSWLGFGNVEFVARRPEVLRVTSHRSQIAWSRNRVYNSDTTSCRKKQANYQILIRARIKTPTARPSEILYAALYSKTNQLKLSEHASCHFRRIFGALILATPGRRRSTLSLVWCSICKRRADVTAISIASPIAVTRKISCMRFIPETGFSIKHLATHCVAAKIFVTISIH